ncbi:MAG TPA: hypothetical protein VI685_16130, partial [Candidatus Angelobacter sp.]
RSKTALTIHRFCPPAQQRGIGYRGWLRIELKQVNQRDVNSRDLKLDIWLEDALQGKHKVNFKRKSDKEWDRSFLIFEGGIK